MKEGCYQPIQDPDPSSAYFIISEKSDATLKMHLPGVQLVM
jgi:hypothetical protein